jgi:2-polyprenyl-3-methyl-5-hydroxy-6-metoxy-1,4-benzoquinol methylase
MLRVEDTLRKNSMILRDIWLPLRRLAGRAIKRGGQQTKDVMADPVNVLNATSLSNQVSKYEIKPGYVEQESPGYFEDIPDGIVYQPDVYVLAGILAQLVGAHYLVDLGCGFAQKLIDTSRCYSLNPIGLDYGANLIHCRDTYPEGQWIEADFENPAHNLLGKEVLERSVIICSDLIEHLRDPTSLVSLLREWLRFARLGLISTPERDVRWGDKHNGPPPNPHHVREWNAEELDTYLRGSGLTVNFVGLTRSKNTAYSMWTMFVLLGATKEPCTSAGEQTVMTGEELQLFGK